MPSSRILFLTASASLLAAIAVGVHAQSRDDGGSSLEIHSPGFRNIMGNTIEDIRNEVNAARLRPGDGIRIQDNEVSVNNTVVRTFGNQTIDGLKIFTNAIAFRGDSGAPIRLSRGSNGVIFSDANNNLQDVVLRNLIASNQITVTHMNATGNIRANHLTANGIATSNLNATGDISAARYFHGSDVRLKANVEDLPEKDIRAALSDLRPVSYTLIAEGEQAFGLVAQEVMEVFPNIVQEQTDGMLFVEYSQLIAPMLVAIRGLERELEAERARVSDLESVLAQIEDRLNGIAPAMPVPAALAP